MRHARHIALALCLSLLGQPALALLGLLPCALPVMAEQPAGAAEGAGQPCHGGSDEAASPAADAGCSACDSVCMQSSLLLHARPSPAYSAPVAPDATPIVAARPLAPPPPLLRPPIVRAG